MKVLHVGVGNLYGGVERLLVTVAENRSLCPEMEPQFACCFPGQLAGELERTGVPVAILGEMRGRDLKAVARNRSRMRELIDKTRPDVVLHHSLWTYNLLAIGLKASIARALWLHGHVQSRGLGELISRVDAPRFVVSNSNYTANSASAIYRSSIKRTIYYPSRLRGASSSPAERKALREDLSTDDEDVVIIQPSRLEPWKGHDIHIEALARLEKKLKWTAWFVGGVQKRGEESYLHSLWELARRHGIEHRLRFLGQRSDVGKLLAAADIHCQPNTGPEPFGLTFVEGLAAGLPVVTSRIGGAVEIVDKTCGILVPACDPRALSGALGKLIVNHELRKYLGMRGPARSNALCDPATRLKDLHQLLDGRSRAN